MQQEADAEFLQQAAAILRCRSIHGQSDRNAQPQHFRNPCDAGGELHILHLRQIVAELLIQMMTGIDEAGIAQHMAAVDDPLCVDIQFGANLADPVFLSSKRGEQRRVAKTFQKKKKILAFLKSLCYYI